MLKQAEPTLHYTPLIIQQPTKTIKDGGPYRQDLLGFLKTFYDNRCLKKLHNKESKKSSRTMQLYVKAQKASVLTKLVWAVYQKAKNVPANHVRKVRIG